MSAFQWAFGCTNNTIQNGKTSAFYGVYGYATNPVGYTCTNLYGLYGFASASHTTDTVALGRGTVGRASQSGAGGTLTQAQGGYFDVTNSAGTIVTAYGVYIGPVAGSTTWGLYQENSGNANFFAGKVGIGITPTAKLHVSGQAGANAFEVLTGSGGGQMTLDEWGNLNFGHNGLGIGYDSVVNQVGFYCTNDLYLLSGWNSGATPRNILLLPASTGQIGLLTGSPTSPVDINADRVRLRTARTPASAAAAGYQGEICWDASFVYVCVAANTWKRAALSTW